MAAMELDGATAVVTGGASGIGRALAEALVAAGARGAVVADRDAARAEAVAAALGPTALAVACDVTREADTVAAVARAEAAFGAVDLFCANAGILAGTDPATPDDVWDRVMDVNLRAHVHAARRLLPGWLECGRGHFLSVASAAGLLAQVGSAPYTVSKHAAVAFAEWLSLTYGDRGIGVTCVCPQAVDTPMLELDDALVGAGAAATLTSGAIVPAAAVAAAALQGVREGRFLVLPHREVAEYWRRKADDPERWLRGMRRLQARALADRDA
jgi:NAD(P)-dependent dehydrogenase (short-subunit alcohol dehydrogenase family)